MTARVVIDGRLAVPSGMARYVHALVRALARLAPDLELVLLSRTPSGLAGGPVREVLIDADYLSPYTMLRAQRAIERLRPDLVHFPFSVAPLALDAPFVLTVHDLMDLHAPGLLHAGLDRWLHAVVRPPWVARSLRRARAVLVPTRAVATDVRLEFPALTAPVHVTSEGVEPAFCVRPRAGRAPAAARRYVLAYGNGRPHKNVPRLIEAFARLAPRVRDVDLHLVVRPGGAAATVRRLVAAQGLADRVRVRPPVADDELVALLNGAAALAFPSLYEGFGLPVLEAMACGCPVVTSGGGGTEEVAGGAAELVEPTSPAAIAAGLERVLGDPAHAARLRRAGLARARGFTWEACARRTLRVYRHCLGLVAHPALALAPAACGGGL